MSQPIGFARSNLFRVKDVDLLRAALQNTDVDVRTYQYDGHLYVTLSPAEGFWPEGVVLDEERDDEEEEFCKLLASHLVEGEVAVLESISHQGMTSLMANSIAVAADGRTEETSLSTNRDDLIAQLGGQKVNAFTENLLPDGASEVQV